jgi:hypothetical protein
VLVAPLRIIHDQRIELEKTTWNGVDVSVYPYPEETAFGIGIKIHNQKLIPITDVMAKIGRIRKERSDVTNQGYDLPWYMEFGGMWQRMYPMPRNFNIGQDGYILVANWDKDSAYFEIEHSGNTPKIMIEPNVKYYFEFLLVGNLCGIRPVFPERKCILEYDGKKVNIKFYEFNEKDNTPKKDSLS